MPSSNSGTPQLSYVSFFANKLTSMTNHYIDFSRTAEFLRSKTHHYNQREVLTRGLMIVTTAACSFFAVHLKKPESNSSTVALAIAGAVIGLTIAHIPIVATMVSKRRKISEECEKYKTLIREDAAKIPDLSINNLNATLRVIDNISLADDKHAYATQTWGHRLTLFKDLHAKLQARDVEVVKALKM